MSDLEQRIKQHAENAVIAFIASTNWLQPDYKNRQTVPGDILDAAWALVDRKAIQKQLAQRIEAELADRIINHIAAELATDIKQILGVTERREMIRQIARDHLTAIMKAGVQS